MIPLGLLSTDKMSGTASNLSTGQKIAPGAKDLFSTIFANMLNSSGMNKVSGEGILSSGDVSRSDKTGLLELVKKFALSKWGSLDKVVINEAGLADFEKFLLGAGFDQASVSSLMEKLKTKMGGRELKLSDLFSALKDLKETEEGEDGTDEEGLLPISALPYIETALSALGMDRSQISMVINESKIEGKGIDLKTLIENLKMIKAGSTEENGAKMMTGNVIAIQQRESSKAQNNQVTNMMMRIGMKDVSEKEGGVTLDSFISGLESLLGKKENSSEIASALNTDLKRFFEKAGIQQDSSSQIQAFGLKSKYLDPGKGNRTSDRYPSLKYKSQATITDENTPESSLVSEKPGREKDFVDGKFIQKVPTGKTDVSDIFKFSDKAPETTSSMTKNDGEISFGSLVRSLDHSEKYSTAAEAKPTARSLPTYVMDQVGRQIIRSVNNGENEIRLQIKPPHLGRLHMTIDHTSDGIKISILAEHRTTKDLILSSTSELKVAIMDQGIHINEIDVQVSSDFQQAMQDMNQKSKEKGRGQEESEDNHNGNDADMMMDGADIAGEMTWFRNGRLNLVA
ncbi:MAG: flagellar hook-length control protein FliK [Proteobacteria bacterium]|nr:flagellar hook-length control protein FliK [Pseudomonadota bacterium]